MNQQEVFRPLPELSADQAEATELRHTESDCNTSSFQGKSQLCKTLFQPGVDLCILGVRERRQDHGLARMARIVTPGVECHVTCNGGIREV